MKSAYKSIKEAESIVRNWETNDLLGKLEKKANKELEFNGNDPRLQSVITAQGYILEFLNTQ